MKDVIIFLSIVIFIIGGIIFSIYSEVLKVKTYKSVINKDEYIQQVEQSLQEQIEEKEVYIKMLEERE